MPLGPGGESRGDLPDIPSDAEAREKFSKVMAEFEAGTLKTSAGEKVTDREQALAIAASEARKVSKSKDNPGHGKRKSRMRVIRGEML